ncbi:hypothetical protein UFOVP1264_80 [uncultured Caudovirales phage]|uniref:Uncharacterized protein n=1 Tax=uncultured Caudovirales phage TaxID=2100421 RepID=A0A6J5RQL5_9CAUD|nr:hypothetical protein UFOVP1264_80 [uncultured Caudovirales phage]
MALTYDQILTLDQKRSILEERIIQFAVDAYRIDLAVQSLSAESDNKTNLQNQLDELNSALEVHQTELVRVLTEIEASPVETDQINKEVIDR